MPNLVECNVTLPRSSPGLFYIHNLETEKVLPWQHLLPDIDEKLTSYYPCRGLERKEPTKLKI